MTVNLLSVCCRLQRQLLIFFNRIYCSADEAEDGVKRHNLRSVFRTVRKIALSPWPSHNHSSNRGDVPMLRGDGQSCRSSWRAPTLQGFLRWTVQRRKPWSVGALTTRTHWTIPQQHSVKVWIPTLLVPFQIPPFLTTHQRWARSGVQFGNWWMDALLGRTEFNPNCSSMRRSQSVSFFTLSLRRYGSPV